jgi:hypothetical protein
MAECRQPFVLGTDKGDELGTHERTIELESDLSQDDLDVGEILAAKEHHLENEQVLRGEDPQRLSE